MAGFYNFFRGKLYDSSRFVSYWVENKLPFDPEWVVQGIDPGEVHPNRIAGINRKGGVWRQVDVKQAISQDEIYAFGAAVDHQGIDSRYLSIQNRCCCCLTVPARVRFLLIEETKLWHSSSVKRMPLPRIRLLIWCCMTMSRKRRIGEVTVV